MEPSSKKGIFVGYSETSKAYRIYILGQRNIEVSRDVTFHKEVAFRHSPVQRRAISLRYIPTDEQTANVFTKPLSKTKLGYFRDMLGEVENDPLAEREC